MQITEYRIIGNWPVMPKQNVTFFHVYLINDTYNKKYMSWNIVLPVYVETDFI